MTPTSSFKYIFRFFAIALCALYFVGFCDITHAVIIFQDDDFGTIESSSIILGRNDAGTTNTFVQFGADPISSSNGTVTWNIASDRFGIDHSVDITGDLSTSNGLSVATGAVNITATSGSLALSGLGTSSISTGANPINFSSSNFTTTATGINNTSIGASTPASGTFTTAQVNSTFAANGNTSIGDASSDTLTITSSILGGTPLSFEGSTNNGTKTNFVITDPTATRNITFPDASGIVSLNTVYQNQNIKNGIRIWNGSATTSSGVATFFPTDTNTNGGNALFTNIYSVQAIASRNTSTANQALAASVKSISADRKTITINVITGTTVIIGGSTLTFAPDGTTVYLTIIGD